MQEMLAKSKAYTVLLLHRTEAARQPDARERIWEHGRRNFELRSEGKLPIVCPVTDEGDLAGIGIFEATPEEVDRIMQDDPGVSAGLFTCEVHQVRGFPGSSLP